MKKLFLSAVVVVLFWAACNVDAGTIGVISTDRFGYTGSVVKYATLADAQNGVNAVETILVGNRDLGLYITNDFGGYGNNNIVTGAWWYTTADNTNDKPKDDPAGNRLYSGYGNTRGNTGIGFIQLYDADGSTDNSLSMSFSDYDGTAYWTKFNLSLSGTNADYSNDYARLSPFTSNTSDKGVYLNYSLTLTAGGLQGIANGGIIEATNHPTSVTGTYSGLFQNLGTDVNKQGFYVFNFTLDMENWAFAQGNEALNGDFSDSYFAVPEPATMSILALGVLAVLRTRR